MTTSTVLSKPTQEQRVLDALVSAAGWVNGQYFLRTLYLSQYHRAIWNLENREDWKARLRELGVRIEHSPFKDEHGFLSYRTVKTLGGRLLT
jgi:hypothetical protein